MTPVPGLTRLFGTVGWSVDTPSICPDPRIALARSASTRPAGLMRPGCLSSLWPACPRSSRPVRTAGGLSALDTADRSQLQATCLNLSEPVRACPLGSLTTQTIAFLSSLRRGSRALGTGRLAGTLRRRWPAAVMKGSATLRRQMQSD